MNANAEARRHNIATEEENVQHNRALESIQEESNRIEQQKNEWLHQREQDKLDWQKQYDTAYLQFQQATGWEKLRLESELNAIKSREADIDAKYKDNLAYVNEKTLELDSAKADEIARHNKQLEELNSRELGIQSYRNELQREQNELTQFKNYSEYVLGLRDIGLKSRDVYTRETGEQRTRWYQEESLKLDTSRTKAQNFRDYTTGVGTILQSTTGVVNSVNSLLGGNNNGKKALSTEQQVKLARKAAEALFAN